MLYFLSLIYLFWASLKCQFTRLEALSILVVVLRAALTDTVARADKGLKGNATPLDAL